MADGHETPETNPPCPKCGNTKTTLKGLRAGSRAEYEALFGHTVFGSGLGILGAGLAAGMAIEPGEKPDLGEKMRLNRLYGKAGG
jgi:hypothetical protein